MLPTHLTRALVLLAFAGGPALADKPLTRTDKATPQSLQTSVAAANSAKACEEFGGPKTLTLKEKLLGEKKDWLDKIFLDKAALASLRAFSAKEFSTENVEARETTMAFAKKPSVDGFARLADHFAEGHAKELNIPKTQQAKACFEALLAEMKKGGKPNAPSALGFAQWLQRQASANVGDTYARWATNKTSCGFQKYGSRMTKEECK